MKILCPEKQRQKGLGPKQGANDELTQTPSGTEGERSKGDGKGTSTNDKIQQSKGGSQRRKPEKKSSGD